MASCDLKSMGFSRVRSAGALLVGTCMTLGAWAQLSAPACPPQFQYLDDGEVAVACATLLVESANRIIEAARQPPSKPFMAFLALDAFKQYHVWVDESLARKSRPSDLEKWARRWRLETPELAVSAYCQKTADYQLAAMSPSRRQDIETRGAQSYNRALAAK